MDSEVKTKKDSVRHLLGWAFAQTPPGHHSGSLWQMTGLPAAALQEQGEMGVCLSVEASI